MVKILDSYDNLVRCHSISGESVFFFSLFFQFASALVTVGEDRNGVVNILVCQMFHVWTTSEVTEHIAKFLPLIVDLCMFGSLLKKGDRYIYLSSIYSKML